VVAVDTIIKTDADRLKATDDQSAQRYFDEERTLRAGGQPTPAPYNKMGSAPRASGGCMVEDSRGRDYLGTQLQEDMAAEPGVRRAFRDRRQDLGAGARLRQAEYPAVSQRGVR